MGPAQPGELHAPDAEVVLADHDGLDIGRGWTFYVLSKGDLEAFPAKTLTPANLARNKYAPVGPGELADAVAREAQKS